MAEDDLFGHGPRAAAVAQPRAIGGMPDKVGDPRRVASVVAGVLHATGAFTQPELDAANHGLAALGRAALVQTDFVAQTPEQLAPVIPRELREPVLALLYQLAGDEPIRRRIADAYAGLWQAAAEPPAPPRAGSPVCAG